MTMCPRRWRQAGVSLHPTCIHYGGLCLTLLAPSAGAASGTPSFSGDTDPLLPAHGHQQVAAVIDTLGQACNQPR